MKDFWQNRTKLHTSQAVAVDSAQRMLHRCTSFEVRRPSRSEDMTLDLSINQPAALTF